MALLAIVYVALTCSAQWLVFAALGIEISPLIVIVTISLGTAAGALSGSPGGITTTEAAMVGTYILLGVTEIDAAGRNLSLPGPALRPRSGHGPALPDLLRTAT